MIRLLVAFSIVGILFSGCKKTTEDFTGIYNFQIMDKYIVKDTSEMVYEMFRNQPLQIPISKMTPLKIDLFKSGEEIKGTFTIVKYQEEFALDIIDKYSEQKFDLKNIHLANDTLLAEVSGLKRAVELKLTKAGDDISLAIKSGEKEREKESCNKFATVKGEYIVYKSLKGSKDETELIDQSNKCSVEETTSWLLENGYSAKKKSHLITILSVTPKTAIR